VSTAEVTLTGVAEVTLSEPQLERLADLVAARLRDATPAATPGTPARLVGARELAALLGVDSKSVYRHARQLGGVQVGRAWRFDVARALAAWPDREADRLASGRSQTPLTPAATGSKVRRRRTSSAPHCQLLPVGRVGSVQDRDEVTS
jgi:hypothetical protein